MVVSTYSIKCLTSPGFLPIMHLTEMNKTQNSPGRSSRILPQISGYTRHVSRVLDITIWCCNAQQHKTQHENKRVESVNVKW